MESATDGQRAPKDIPVNDVAADPDATAAEMSEQIDYAKKTLKELTDAQGEGY